jgi:cobalt transporter subunit CbtB
MATGASREGRVWLPIREPGDLPALMQLEWPPVGWLRRNKVTTNSTTPATSPVTTTTVSERAEVRNAALAAMAFGVALVFTVGFASPSTIHNAAHDTRHALSFPCQ